MTDQVLSGVGAQLKQAREGAGLGIDTVAQQLRLVPRQIESLEHERFDRLPGPAIARGMVRNYARLLNLDPDALVERMAPRVEKAPEPATARRRPMLLYAGFFVVLLALAGAAAYGWQKGKAAPEIATTAQTAEPIEVLPALSETPPAPAANESPTVPLVKTEAAAKPEPEPRMESPTLPPGSHRLVLRMGEEAWLEVRDGAGRSLVSSLNPAGSERAVRGQPPFQLVIGNAPHVELTYNGKPVDLEPYIKGEVARLTLQ